MLWLVRAEFPQVMGRARQLHASGSGSSGGPSPERTVRDHENRIETARSCFERLQAQQSSLQSSLWPPHLRISPRNRPINRILIPLPLIAQPGSPPRNQLRAAAISAAPISAAPISATAVRSRTAALRAATLRRTGSRSATVPAGRALAGSQRRPARAASGAHRTLSRRTSGADPHRVHLSRAGGRGRSVVAADARAGLRHARPDRRGSRTAGRLGSQREGAHRLPRRPRHVEPQPRLDHLPRRRLLQPAAGRDADRPGAPRSRPAGRQLADHSAGRRERQPGLH